MAEMTFSSEGEVTTTLDGLLPKELDDEATAEVQALAKLYHCRPDQLVQAVGRQLLCVDGRELPVSEHRDVFALEAVARLVIATGCAVMELPEVEPRSNSELAVIGHVRHIKTCDECKSSVDRLLSLFPKQNELRALID